MRWNFTKIVFHGLCKGISPYCPNFQSRSFINLELLLVPYRSGGVHFRPSEETKELVKLPPVTSNVPKRLRWTLGNYNNGCLFQT